jgi:hypothetical protein
MPSPGPAPEQAGPRQVRPVAPAGGFRLTGVPLLAVVPAPAEAGDPAGQAVAHRPAARIRVGRRPVGRRPAGRKPATHGPAGHRRVVRSLARGRRCEGTPRRHNPAAAGIRTARARARSSRAAAVHHAARHQGSAAGTVGRLCRHRARAGRGARADQPGGPVRPARPDGQPGGNASAVPRCARPAYLVRWGRKPPRSRPDGRVYQIAMRRRAVRSHRPRLAGRPGAGPRHYQPSRRWKGRCASQCHRRSGRSGSPVPRSSPVPQAGLPILTRRIRRRGQTRAWSSGSSIRVRAFRPLLAHCALH